MAKTPVSLSNSEGVMRWNIDLQLQLQFSTVSIRDDIGMYTFAIPISCPFLL